MNQKENETVGKYKNIISQTLGQTEKEVKRISKPVFFDGRQYSIRVPKKLAEAVALDKEKDKFEFELKYVQKEGKLVPELRGVLVRGS